MYLPTVKFQVRKNITKNKKNYLNKLINQLKKTVTLFSSQAVQKKKTFHKKKILINILKMMKKFTSKSFIDELRK